MTKPKVDLRCVDRALEGLATIEKINRENRVSEKGIENRVVWPIIESLGDDIATFVQAKVVYRKLRNKTTGTIPDYTIWNNPAWRGDKEIHALIEVKNFADDPSVQKLYNRTSSKWRLPWSKKDHSPLYQCWKQHRIANGNRRKPKHYLCVVSDGRVWVAAILPSNFEFKSMAEIKRKIILRVNIEDHEETERLIALHPKYSHLLCHLIRGTYGRQTSKTEDDEHWSRPVDPAFGDWQQLCQQIDRYGHDKIAKSVPIKKTKKSRKKTKELTRAARGVTASQATSSVGELAYDAVATRLRGAQWRWKKVPKERGKTAEIHVGAIHVGTIRTTTNTASFRMFSRVIIQGGKPAQFGSAKKVCNANGSYYEEHFGPKVNALTEVPDFVESVMVGLRNEWPEGFTSNPLTLVSRDLEAIRKKCSESW